MAYSAVMPAPISAGRFGIVRISGTPGPSQRAMSCKRIPAATEMTSAPEAATWPAIERATCAICCGFTASTTVRAPVTADGAKADSFWTDPLVQKYKPQIETMIANSANGMLFGFTNGRTFPSIAPISGQNVLSEVLQAVVIDGTDPAAAVAAGQARMQDIAQ